MKKTLLSGFAILLISASLAQSSKQVQWAYSAKKIADRTYEVHMIATINGDYHLYSQDVGGEGPVPTSFSFVKSPLLALDGRVKEAGKLIRKFETAWSHDVRYYEKIVDFVQVVKLKSNIKTDFAGKVEFMVCNDKQCLPPAEVEIKVNVGG
jgi:hypothetical protein